MGSTPFVLYINILWHFCTFLVKLGDLCLSFFHSPLADFIFFFIFIVAQLNACVFCIALLVGLAVVPLRVPILLLLLFFYRKQTCFGSEGVVKDKLVFGMLKHGHVSSQILT